MISYAILDKEKKIDKYIHKVIQPSLHKIIIEFKSLYSEANLSEVSRFKNFKQNLDNIFGADTKTIDQKLKGLF